MESRARGVESVLDAQRQLQLRDVELSAEMLEWPVVLRNGSDTKGGESCFRAQFGDDLFDHAEAPWHRHAASLRTLNRRYELC